MERIDKYIKSLKKDVYLSPAEMADFKDEIRGHLLETVNELQQQGLSEDESITAALNKFGAEKLINTELRKTVRFQNKFTRSMLKISAVFLALSLLLVVFSQLLAYRNSTDFDTMQRQYHELIEARILSGETIGQTEIAAFYNENKRILRFVHLTNTDSHKQAEAYSYPPDIPKQQLNEQPYMTYPVQVHDGNSNWDVKIAFNGDALFSQTPNVLLLLAGICFAAYWILYGLWNVINAYRMSRLHAGWVILFFTLNVFAYLLFQLERAIKTRKFGMIS